MNAVAERPAWCFSPSLLLRTATPGRSITEFSVALPKPRATRRRPRSVFFECSHVTPPTRDQDGNAADSAGLPTAQDTELPPPATENNGDIAHAGTAAVHSRLQFGLLKDSVLEEKWRKEIDCGSYPKEEVQAPCTTCANATSSGVAVTSTYAYADDLSASDPYEAFARFTRIAAPTAALGRDGVEPLMPDIDSRLRSAATQYSTAGIAYRLMRYSYARKSLADFLARFQGEFDNYEQVAEERAEGVLPGDGGGHEHIHCSIVAVKEDMLFARYYFNGDPSIVFRARLYKVQVAEDCDRGIIEMRIFRFYEETERKLKVANYDVNAIEWDDGDVYDWLKGCEVYWERYQPEDDVTDEASIQLGIESGPRFVGYMKDGGCEVFSRETGGKIRVMDDLLLTSKELWVADRGFDEENQFIYGNRRGVPYKMKRVTADGHMAWTLSPDLPAPEGYMS